MRDDGPNVCPTPKDYDGPCRESAATMLTRLIAAKRHQLAGLEALLKVAERAENGSPLEEALWEMLCQVRSGV